MKHFLNFFILGLCFVFSSTAQVKNEVLFKIDDQEFKTDSFLNSIQKNSDLTASNQETLEQHLERYINFRLKLNSAYAKQMDTLPAFQREFASYYKQIADNYISNGEVTEAMVRESYDRTKTEVKASHILLRLPKNEKDTAEVYQKALMIKDKIESGEDFEVIAQRYSEDPSVKTNAGDLGWFNSFKMIYEFEDAAYKLDENEISMPLRTEYGYHLIQKTGERPSKGKIETAHIMMFSRDSLKNTKESIQKIYKRIQEGEDFHELAKQYSQDKNTAESGGYVSAFSLGGLNSKTYENKVYELENNGDITEPFQTQFGWHIVKLINTTPLEPYEEVKEEFKKKLKTSNRSKLLVSKIKEDLEKLYKVEINDEAKDYFVEALDSTYAKFKWKYKPSETDSSNYIFQVEGQKVDYNTFGEHLEKKQRSYSGLTSYDAIIDNAIDDLVYSELLSYHKIQLPKVDSEFAERVEEFKDGLLIYDYIQSQVWTPVAKDTVAQKRYYDTHKSEFTTPEQITGQLYTSKSKKALKKVVDRLKNEGENDFQLPDEVIAEDVELETQSKRLPKKLKPELGLTKIYKHSGQFLLLNILEVQKPSIPEFENVKGRVMSILQDEKENELISELRSTYDIFIDEDVLNNLKMEFEN